jgi:hypothetical protein
MTLITGDLIDYWQSYKELAFFPMLLNAVAGGFWNVLGLLYKD